MEILKQILADPTFWLVLGVVGVFFAVDAYRSFWQTRDFKWLMYAAAETFSVFVASIFVILLFAS